MVRKSYMGVVPLSFMLLLVWLSNTWNEHHYFDDPVKYSLWTLFVAGWVLFALSKTKAPLVIGRSKSNDGDDDYARLPEDERNDDFELTAVRRKSVGSENVNQKLQPLMEQKIMFIAMAVSIALRISLSQEIQQSSQCAVQGLEGILLPTIFAFYDFLKNPYRKTADDERDSIANTIYEDFYDFIKWSRVRYIPLAISLSLSIHFLASPNHVATSMCFGVSRQRSLTIFLQFVGLVLDVAIIIISWNLVKTVKDDKRRVGLLAQVVISSQAMIAVCSILLTLFGKHSFAENFKNSSSLGWGSILDGFALALFLWNFSYLAKDLRPVAIVHLATFICAFAPLLFHSLSERKPFPPQTQGRRISGLILMVTSFLVFIIVYKAAEVAAGTANILRRINLLWYVLLVGGAIFGAVAIALRRPTVGFHPVKLMLYQANAHSSRWSKQAHVSDSLQVAVHEYATRYYRLPPPNFDKWFAFAKERNCQIIDNYDQINKDLLPFWGIEPSTIRAHSVQKNNDFAVMEINKQNTGDIIFSDGGLRNVAEMISKFADHLPAMQLVFSKSSKPQVAIPYSARKRSEDKALSHMANPRAVGEAAVKSFSFHPEGDWPDVPNPKDLKAANPSPVHLSTWDAYISNTCPSPSPAWRHPFFSTNLCVRCAAPHSINQFMANFSLSRDVCLQPDLASIHPFLASPAMEPAHGYGKDTLVPIFSARKTEGHNDILYPFPGGFASGGEAKNKPWGPFANLSFKNLTNDLYWRGNKPSTEGLCTNAWQGLAEERLVYLGNTTALQETKEKTVFLVPLDEEGKKYQNAFVPASVLASQLPLNASFHAAGDTGDQDRFLHKYSLTLDSDGVGKFLEDVQSPMAAVRSGIMKSWYDDRLQPWLHYIPLDMRWHGLYPTLAYFFGIRGEVKGQEVTMNRRTNEGKWIADEGRKRVETVVREADAEVYMFRLLLEWARITDDARESLGFAV